MYRRPTPIVSTAAKKKKVTFYEDLYPDAESESFVTNADEEADFHLQNHYNFRTNGQYDWIYKLF